MSISQLLNEAIPYLLSAEERAEFMGREELAKKLKVIRRAAAKVMYEEQQKLGTI